jgi:beta-glucosidase
MRPNGREGGYAGLNKKHLQGDRYDPEFPFGFGLSYTNFAFSDLQLSTKRALPGSTTTIRVKVTNTGERAGETVAQLYVAAQWQPIVPRARKLCDFARVALEPGESKIVTLSLAAKDLSYLDHTMQPVFGPGDYIVTVGEHCLATLSARLATAGAAALA